MCMTSIHLKPPKRVHLSEEASALFVAWVAGKRPAFRPEVAAELVQTTYMGLPGCIEPLVACVKEGEPVFSPLTSWILEDPIQKPLLMTAVTGRFSSKYASTLAARMSREKYGDVTISPLEMREWLGLTAKDGLKTSSHLMDRAIQPSINAIRSRTWIFDIEALREGGEADNNGKVIAYRVTWITPEHLWACSQPCSQPSSKE